MFLKDITFTNWCRNHAEDHDDKWCRELYPYDVFRCIDFSEDLLNLEQKVEFNWVDYFVVVRKIELQESGRYRTTFDLSTVSLSKSQSWKKRTWNLSFQIVYTPENSFVTVFTRKEDPSKDFVTRFMRGNFERINLNRSIPISELLFKTLVLHISEDNSLEGKHNARYSFVPGGVRTLSEHPQFKQQPNEFSPLYSIDRKLWICFSFTEEKAHRLAYHIANQAEELIVVYCNPSYTKHHRCAYPGTHLVSLFEFANMVSSEVRLKYERQIRFLQNHLNPMDGRSIEELKAEIMSPMQKEEHEIRKSDLMEALGIIKILPSNESDAFHAFSAFNLINAFLSRNRSDKSLHYREKELFRNMYSFKAHLANTLDHLIETNAPFVRMSLVKDLAIIEVMEFQFSFHSVPKNQILLSYERSARNKEIKWSGKRMQPIAPLLFYYSRELRVNSYLN